MFEKSWWSSILFKLIHFSLRFNWIVIWSLIRSIWKCPEFVTDWTCWSNIWDLSLSSPGKLKLAESTNVKSNSCPANFIKPLLGLGSLLVSLVIDIFLIPGWEFSFDFFFSSILLKWISIWLIFITIFVVVVVVSFRKYWYIFWWFKFDFNLICTVISSWTLVPRLVKSLLTINVSTLNNSYESPSIISILSNNESS